MTATDVHKGRNIHGFIVTDTIDLPELNLRQIQLVHERTGARYLHLAADDDNCLFAACFRTPPEDSTGVAHILEHTVLCGSERYPVRDPFFAMIKRSLNTFMNAMTASDWTSYPFASQNPRDFDNLLGIYLDAVFFPLLREEDFLQEGHRLEFDEEGRLTIQGVVFNEMKGAMASPSSLLSRRLAKALYPTTTYRHNSGGEPEHIPELTWQQLRDFHARYYHPSNSWLFSYGNRPLEQILEQVDRLALSRFERLEVDSAVPPEKRLEQPRQVEERFPLDPAEPLAGRSMVQIGWLTCDIEQGEERMLLHLLSLLLLGNPAAPLYRALLESGLGSNLAPGCGYHDDNRTTCFAAGLQGTDPDKAEAIEQLV
ncbi:MAG: peptidase M16, partial [Deltaproteobacteria bacterium]